MGHRLRTSLKEMDQEAILWLAHDLMAQDSGDGDCTVVCKDYREWAEAFKQVIEDRNLNKFGDLEITEYPDAISFAWNQEYIVFRGEVPPEHIESDFFRGIWCGYTWMIIVEE